MRPEAKTFQCRGTVTEDSRISMAQHGINFVFGPSLGVSRVYNVDHFVVYVHDV